MADGLSHIAHTLPTLAAVGALLQPRLQRDIQHLCVLGINGDGDDRGAPKTRQLEAFTAVGAAKEPALCSRPNDLLIGGISGQGDDIAQPLGLGIAPASAIISALVETLIAIVPSV